MFILDQKHSIGSQFIAELRDIEIQKDRMRFRRNLERIGEIMAYEISKTFDYQPIDITTPLGIDPSMIAAERPVLISILRAGLPFHTGFLNYFDRSDCGFIGAYRMKDLNKDNEVDIDLSYIAAPPIQDKVLILVDPMMATGKSLVKAYKNLIDSNGTPSTVHVVSVIAAQAGLDLIQKEIPEATIWLGALDGELNEKFYIVPGLGDAGDLSFGPKL